jgi:hypothetical protein
MALNTEQRQNVIYFTGIEVEHTVCYGMRTLFVVGTPPVEDILNRAKQADVEQIYFGTSQSFNPKNIEDWERWDHNIMYCLRAGYWVTLDFDIKHVDQINEYGWCEQNRFVPMISVKIPNIKLFNYHTTLKIDDVTWGSTNPGVWTHQLHDLMNKTQFTGWHKYINDTAQK